MNKISVDVSSILSKIKQYSLNNGNALYSKLVKKLRLGVPLCDETDEPEPDSLPEQFENIVESK